MEKRAEGTKKRVGAVINVLLVLLVLAGLGLLLYPSFSDWWNRRVQTRAVAGYVDQVSDLSGEAAEKLWMTAQAYNAGISRKGMHFPLSDEETEEYNTVLDVTGTGIMGYVQIPKIHVELPIYHSTSDAVLQIAVGHLAGSSLPVGGADSHCVLSGHRGLPSSRLFTDLDQMETGDTFTLQVLDHTMTYEVDRISTVLPDELDELAIEEGQDLCTLMTCTPYGINTHRLLVRGHRIANPGGDVKVQEDAAQVNIREGLPAAGVLIVLLMMAFRKKRRKADCRGSDLPRNRA